MWFTIYETATGAIKCHQSIPAVDLPPEFSVREDEERQDQTNIWDAGARLLGGRGVHINDANAVFGSGDTSTRLFLCRE